MIPWRWAVLVVASATALGFALARLVDPFVGVVTGCAAGAGLLIAPERLRSGWNLVLTFAVTALATALLFFTWLKR